LRSRPVARASKTGEAKIWLGRAEETAAYVLDVIALVDASRVSHEPAHVWFAAEGRRGWATCPIRENGLMRIITNPRYPNAVAPPPRAPWPA